MKTKLEQIENAQELLTYIAAFGIPTDTDSICRMQDIIGHSSIDDLVALARDNGTEVRNGQTWSTGRKGTQRDMMSLLFHIWNWEDATRFYNTYVNAEYLKMKEIAADVKIANDRAKEAQEAAEHNMKIWEEADAKAFELESELKEAKNEIQRLKALLFDYMTK